MKVELEYARSYEVLTRNFSRPKEYVYTSISKN